MHVVPCTDTAADTIFVAVEHHKRSFDAVDLKVPVHKRVLVCVEPFVINPVQFSSRVRAAYGHVISISPELGPGHVDELWDGGHLGNLDEVRRLVAKSSDEYREPRSVAMLNANKFSAVPGSLYRRRFEVLSEFTQMGTPTHLGGYGWNSSYWRQIKPVLYTSAQALRLGMIPMTSEFGRRSVSKLRDVRFFSEVPSAVAFFRKFEFGIAIENQLGYFTEKPLNVMLGGAIPLYLGSDVTKFGVPKDAVVNVALEFDGDFCKAYSEVVRDSDRKRRMIALGREWLESGKANERWGTMEGQRKLASLLVQYWRRINS